MKVLFKFPMNQTSGSLDQRVENLENYHENENTCSSVLLSQREIHTDALGDATRQGPQFKFSFEGLSPEIDILIRSNTVTHHKKT